MNHFHEKFARTFNDESCQTNKVDFSEILNDNVFYFTLDEVNKVIMKLNNMEDPDKIHAYHFQFASSNLKYLIFRFLNCCMAQSHFPKQMIVAECKPRLKDNLRV